MMPSRVALRDSLPAGGGPRSAPRTPRALVGEPPSSWPVCVCVCVCVCACVCVSILCAVSVPYTARGEDEDEELALRGHGLVQPGEHVARVPEWVVRVQLDGAWHPARPTACERVNKGPHNSVAPRAGKLPQRVLEEHWALAQALKRLAQQHGMLGYVVPECAAHGC